MKWDKVQRAAKREDYLVYAMDQSQTSVMSQPGPWGSAHDGYCAGLAIHWIALRYAGKDFPYDRKTMECEMPDWRATQTQNVYEGHGDEADKVSLAFAKYGLFLNQARILEKDGPPTGSDLRKIGYSGKGCYYISFFRPASGGHAVAMHRRPGHSWHFFDANYGEFRAINGETFENFINWFMRHSGYKDRYNGESYVFGVNPPPYIKAAALKSMIK